MEVDETRNVSLIIFMHLNDLLPYLNEHQHNHCDHSYLEFVMVKVTLVEIFVDVEAELGE